MVAGRLARAGPQRLTALTAAANHQVALDVLGAAQLRAAKWARAVMMVVVVLVAVALEAAQCAAMLAVVMLLRVSLVIMMVVAVARVPALCTAVIAFVVCMRLVLVSAIGTLAVLRLLLLLPPQTI